MTVWGPFKTMPLFLTEVRVTSREGGYKGTNVRKNKICKCKGTNNKSNFVLDKGDKKTLKKQLCTEVLRHNKLFQKKQKGISPK
jgi:hypothetical protein